jgi:hypothetical protein
VIGVACRLVRLVLRMLRTPTADVPPFTVCGPFATPDEARWAQWALGQRFLRCSQEPRAVRADQWSLRK